MWIVVGCQWSAVSSQRDGCGLWVMGYGLWVVRGMVISCQAARLGNLASGTGRTEIGKRSSLLPHRKVGKRSSLLPLWNQCPVLTREFTEDSRRDFYCSGFRGFMDLNLLFLRESGFELYLFKRIDIF